MKLGSLFDGSGGFPLAGVICGITPVWASEVEKFPIAVTRKRLPGMKHLGDIREINGAVIQPVNIITFGSPCQDLSIAEKRAGLEGARSGLFAEAVRIVKEMRCATNGRYPRYIVWENVPGAFSSNKGEDYRTVLQEIAQIADTQISIPRSAAKWNGAGEIVAETYSIAYRTFDAQFWGVPQRRRRIYLVADFRGQRAGKILFEREGLSWHPAARGRTWKEIAGYLNRRVALPGRTVKIEKGDNRQSQYVAGFHWYKSASAGVSYAKELSPALEATMPNSVLCAGFSAGQSVRAGSLGYQQEQSPTLRGASSGTNQVPVVCFLQKDYTEFTEANIGGTLMARGGSRNLIVTLNIHNCRDRKCIGYMECRKNKPVLLHPEVTGTLYASGAGTNRVAGQANEADMCICISGNTIERQIQNGGNGKGYSENVGYTLNTVDRHAVMAIDCRNDRNTEISGTLQAKGNGGYSLGCQNPIMIAPTLDASYNTKFGCDQFVKQ